MRSATTARRRTLQAATKALTERLIEARGHRAMDSPLFQLLEGYQAAPIDRLKTDVFRTQVAYAEALKKKLADARAGGVAALDAVRDGLGDIDAVEAGVAVDLLLSYRALSEWERVVDLCGRLDRALAAHRAGARAMGDGAQPARARPRGRGDPDRDDRASAGRRARPAACSAASIRTAGRRRARTSARSRRAAICARRSPPIGRASRPTGATPIPASTRRR